MKSHFLTVIGFLLMFFLILFFVIWVIVKLVFHEFFPRTRAGNRVIPIDILIRIRQERLEREARERYIIELEKYNKVIAELKNKVIVINPNNILSIGTKS